MSGLFISFYFYFISRSCTVSHTTQYYCVLPFCSRPCYGIFWLESEFAPTTIKKNNRACFSLLFQRRMFSESELLGNLKEFSLEFVERFSEWFNASYFHVSMVIGYSCSEKDTMCQTFLFLLVVTTRDQKDCLATSCIINQIRPESQDIITECEQ